MEWKGGGMRGALCIMCGACVCVTRVRATSFLGQGTTLSSPVGSVRVNTAGGISVLGVGHNRRFLVAARSTISHSLILSFSLVRHFCLVLLLLLFRSPDARRQMVLIMLIIFVISVSICIDIIVNIINVIVDFIVIIFNW